MTRKIVSGAKAPSQPSPDDVLAFVNRERARAQAEGHPPPKIGKREIARAFRLKGEGKVALKAALKALEAEGAIERRRKTFRARGAVPDMVLADVRRLDRDGELLAEPVEWDAEAHGPAPAISIETRRGRGPAPGLGDRVLLRLRRLEGEPAAYLGRVLKILDKGRLRTLGVFRVGAEGGARIVPIDKKALGQTLAVGHDADGGAQDGDLVAVETGRAGRPARVVERLGSVKDERAISLIALRRHGIPDSFGADALAEAQAVRPVPLDGREDWRSLPFVTIDPTDARDHDDAVHAAADEERANPGGFVLSVAIADVAAYVRPGGALDREALERGNSVYFPGRVVPMLPERISNDLCSLLDGADRPALAVSMTIDREGRKLRHSFHRVMIRSAAKLAYERAQAAIEGAPDAATTPLVEPVLRPLWAAYEALKRARARRSPLDLELPERKIVLNARGGVDSVATPARLDAHRLIEEFMILANVAAAETLEDRRQPLIYRVHDQPSFEKINDLSQFLSTLGLKLAKGQVLRPAQFNALLAQAAGARHETLVNEAVLRAQAQAEYAARNYGHFGLHLRRYAHFTSPIRRYADLCVHRALIAALDLGGEPSAAPALGDLEEISARISAAERRAVAAERETVDRLIASWLAERIGATFDARISGVVRSGLFVRLEETGADGFVPAASLGSEYFRFDERRRALVGGQTKRILRLGDGVRVRLVEAAPFAGALRFELMGLERRAASPGRAGRARDTTSPGESSRSRPFEARKAKSKR